MGQIVVFALLSFYYIKIGYYTNIVFDRFYQKSGFATSLSLHPHHQSHSEARFFPGTIQILALVVSRNLELFMSQKRDWCWTKENNTMYDDPVDGRKELKR